MIGFRFRQDQRKLFIQNSNNNYQQFIIRSANSNNNNNYNAITINNITKLNFKQITNKLFKELTNQLTQILTRLIIATTESIHRHSENNINYIILQIKNNQSYYQQNIFILKYNMQLNIQLIYSFSSQATFHYFQPQLDQAFINDLQANSLNIQYRQNYLFICIQIIEKFRKQIEAIRQQLIFKYFQNNINSFQIALSILQNGQPTKLSIFHAFIISIFTFIQYKSYLLIRFSRKTNTRMFNLIFLSSKADQIVLY
ncbi:hypothetical protein ABPG72_019168 [Tetrahymena utriculariae]